MTIIASTVDIKDFAKRTERLCDFLLAQVETEMGRDGSRDLKIIEDLKEDAANIQFDYPKASETLSGLHDYMNGV